MFGTGREVFDGIESVRLVGIMFLAKSAFTLLPIVVLSCLVAGCGKADGDTPTDPSVGELGEIYEIYTAYLKVNEEPPTKFADIKKPEYEVPYPQGFQTLN